MRSNSLKTTRRFIAHEVVQTSMMDCGPASLKCLLEGFHIRASYGRLREACQTDVDGTSIDTIEEAARQLGLEAAQMMLPKDYLLLPESEALPALVITRNPDGNTHFVVLWRRHAHVVQVMDPATGRRWMSQTDFLKELYIHTFSLPATDWREWAVGEGFLKLLRARLSGVGVSSKAASAIIDSALADEGWRSIAALDAAARMVASIVRAGGLRRGRQAESLIAALFERARSEANETDVTPENYWMVRPAPSESDGQPQYPERRGGGSSVQMRGAVLVSVSGRRAADEQYPDRKEGDNEGREGSSRPPLSPELAAALEEKPERPGRELISFLRADGLLAPASLMAALGLAAGGSIEDG
ncbi:MAG: cysteine peptidase family C39 domain-containing protein [Blastocatellia bacterium]|nr:cysteine peptidase family C39 domain-containing protein [Blastocatellia bacterium]